MTHAIVLWLCKRVKGKPSIHRGMTATATRALGLAFFLIPTCLPACACLPAVSLSLSSSVFRSNAVRVRINEKQNQGWVGCVGPIGLMIRLWVAIVGLMD